MLYKVSKTAYSGLSDLELSRRIANLEVRSFRKQPDRVVELKAEVERRRLQRLQQSAQPEHSEEEEEQAEPVRLEGVKEREEAAAQPVPASAR